MKMTPANIIVLYLVTGFFVFKSVAENEQNGTFQGLRCYACADTGGNNICEDFDTYKTAMDGKGLQYIKKNCTSPYNDSCYIETYSVLGNTVSHIRDCGDGKHYSFTSSLQYNRSAYKRLEDLLSNNETACVWDGQNQVCLSKCESNFCNGPQLTEVNDAVFATLSLSLLLFSLSVFVNNIRHR